MARLTAELRMIVPGEGRMDLDDLELDPTLIEDMTESQREDPDGAVVLTNGVRYLFIEDTLNGLTDFFLTEVVAALETGTEIRYSFRTGPEYVVASFDGDTVRIDYDGKEDITAPKAEFLAAMAGLAEEVGTLETLLEMVEED